MKEKMPLPKLEELAKLVAEWEKIDDQVAKEGWTASLEEAWDNAITGMVSAANAVLHNDSNEARRCKASS